MFTSCLSFFVVTILAMSSAYHILSPMVHGLKSVGMRRSIRSPMFLPSGSSSGRLFGSRRHLQESQGKKKGSKYQSESEDNGLRASGPLLNGLVIERHSNKLLVEFTTPNGNKEATTCIQRKHFLDNTQIVCGDKVKFHFYVPSAGVTASGSTATGIIEEMEERTNVLQRPSAGSSRNKVVMKPIASNIDQILVIVACQPHVPIPTIDRYIVASLLNDIPEVHLVVNKADLSDSADLYKSLSYYRSLDHQLILASASPDTPKGLDALKAILRGKVSILVGQSGVGKTSLINALLPQLNARVGDLVGQDRFGAHTTSNARMYYLDENGPEAGKIIDSPGIRELGTWHLSAADIQEGFREIHNFAQGCKFRNCQHEEKDAKFCAVFSAVQRGEIRPERYSSYIALRDQHHD